VIVVCRAANRCIEVAKALFQLGKSVRVGQLYSKHMKIGEQERQLRAAQMHIAVGTPERLRKLVDSGALSLSDLLLIVIDLSKDVKGYHTLDLPDTQLSFYRFYAAHLHTLVKERVKIMLY